MNILFIAAVDLGPVVGGLIYDATGQYRGFIGILIVALVASSMLLLSLGDYPSLPDTTLRWAKASSVVRD